MLQRFDSESNEGTEHHNDLLNSYEPQCQSLQNKKSWICSLCSKSIPMDIKQCICIGNNFQIKKNKKTIENKDCLIVIKELAETLHSSISFNLVPQEFKISAKPFEYEIYFDGQLIANGVGNSKRKAQRHGAESALNELALRGHARKINLLQKFARIGHSQIDRSSFVEICRDISDESDVYVVDDDDEEYMMDVHLLRSVDIDESPDIIAYETRTFEISQLEEPSVLGCLDVCGPLKYSLIAGIFHKDVNNGRYGYNCKHHHKAQKKNCKVGDVHQKRGKKKRKRKRKKVSTATATTTTNGNEEEGDKEDKVSTELSVNDKHESTDSAVSTLSNISSVSISDANTTFVERTELISNSIPNRRHTVGSTIAANRNKNIYSHPSKYEHHGIYCIDDSPLSLQKQQSKRRQRRRHILEIQDDVHHCSECGQYFADNTNGRHLSEDDEPKWLCFECIKRMEETLMKPFIECPEYIQRKEPESVEKKKNKITPPMTPPSSEENNVENNKKAMELPEIVIQQIFDDEMKQSFVGPHTPSSPSSSDKAKKIEQKTSEPDQSEEEEEEEGVDSKTDTVSIATQVNGTNSCADKAIQAIDDKSNYAKNTTTKQEMNSTFSFLDSDHMTISAQSLIDDEWKTIHKYNRPHYHQKGTFIHSKRNHLALNTHSNPYNHNRPHMIYTAYPPWGTFYGQQQHHAHQQNVPFVNIMHHHQNNQTTHHHHHHRHHSNSTHSQARHDGNNRYEAFASQCAAYTDLNHI